MQYTKITEHLAIIDMVMLARKATIDRMDMPTEIPTDMMESSLWVSNLFRKYIKKLFPSCYVRRNKNSFSIRLDEPLYTEIYKLYSRIPQINSDYYETNDAFVIARDFMRAVREALGLNNNVFSLRIRPDDTLFIYLDHTRSIYANRRNTFTGLLVATEGMVATMRNLYDTQYQNVLRAVEFADENRRNRLRPRRRPALRPDPAVQPASNPTEYATHTTVTTTAWRTAEIIANEVAAPTPQVELTPVEAARVNDAEQQRFNDILRRMSGTAPSEPVANAEDDETIETAATIEPTLIESLFQFDNSPRRRRISRDEILARFNRARMIPNFDVLSSRPRFNNLIALDTECTNHFIEVESAEFVSEIINEIEIPEGIPTTKVWLDKEFCYDVQGDLEDAVKAGPNGIYYTAEPMYRVVVNGEIIGRETQLSEAQRIYADKLTQLGLTDNQHIVYYPVNSVNEATARQLRRDIVPRYIADSAQRAANPIADLF